MHTYRLKQGQWSHISRKYACIAVLIMLLGPCVKQRATGAGFVKMKEKKM